MPYTAQKNSDYFDRPFHSKQGPRCFLKEPSPAKQVRLRPCSAPVAASGKVPSQIPQVGDDDPSSGRLYWKLTRLVSDAKLIPDSGRQTDDALLSTGAIALSSCVGNPEVEWKWRLVKRTGKGKEGPK
jgi:hypothetical protein